MQTPPPQYLRMSALHLQHLAAIDVSSSYLSDDHCEGLESVCNEVDRVIAINNFTQMMAMTHFWGGGVQGSMLIVNF